MNLARRPPADTLQGESGAALVLALVFLIIGSLTVLSLTNLAGTNLENTANLQGQRTVEYTADGAMDAAIQAIRYQANVSSHCPFHTSWPIDGISYNVFVSCTGTPINATVTANSPTLSAVPGSSFVPQDVGQVVYEYPGTTAIPAGTTVAGYLNPTTLSMSQRASGGASDVYVGTPAERLVSFDACTSQSSLTSCPGTQAVIAAVVLYFDTDANGVPGLTGYNSTIESWVVNSANG